MIVSKIAKTFFSRPGLMTIKKAFVRVHLDYGEVIYNKV